MDTPVTADRITTIERPDMDAKRIAAADDALAGHPDAPEPCGWLYTT